MGTLLYFVRCRRSRNTQRPSGLVSVGCGELLTEMFGLFELIDEDNGEVFRGDAALTLGVDDQFGGAEAEFARTLAGLN